MLNQAAVEALYSATYIENYLDCVENLPDDLQRHITRVRELDVTYQGFLKEVEQQQDILSKDVESIAKKKSYLVKVQQILISAQEVGDQKLQTIQQIQDIVENKARQLEIDYRNLVDIGKNQDYQEVATKETSTPTHGHGAVTTTSNTSSNNNNNNSSNTNNNNNNHNSNNTSNNNNSSGGVNNVNNNGNGSAGGGGGGERQSKRARRTRNDTVSNELSLAEVSPTPDPINVQPVQIPQPAVSNSASSHKKAANTTTTGKKKKRKSRQSSQQQQQQQQQQQTPQRDETSPHDEELAIDPDEPTYCLCDQISYGEMIMCDNDLCPFEWFHFSCVSLGVKPKGKWYCPKCRGDRSSIMKPKAQFLKELERYNKEKELKEDKGS